MYAKMLLQFPILREVRRHVFPELFDQLSVVDPSLIWFPGIEHLLSITGMKLASLDCESTEAKRLAFVNIDL